MATARTPSTLSARQFFSQFLRVPSGGGLVPLHLHTEQARLLDAWDAVDPSTGLPLYLEVAAIWLKKAGKSATAAGLALAELVAGADEDREIIIVASDLAQSKDIVFSAACRFVRRQQWLSNHIRILSHELIYKQTVTDQRTGGRHTQEHIIRAVPARDARSLHGANQTLTVVDELWAQADYGVLEALAPSPTRRVSRTLYTSYVGLRSQMREGVPIWDLWQRTDSTLFKSYIGGPDGWKQIPWIKAAFIEAQRRRLASVPSKFKRLWQNEWSAGDEGSFLTGEEIHAAIDPALTEPERGEPGITYTIGVDLGLTFDWTAVVVSHVGADHRLVVDVVRFWRGTRTKPVSLVAVEEEIIALSRRFPVERCVLDQWQSQYLSERLNTHGLHNTFTVAVDPSRLDRMATQLKRVFSARQIRVPQHAELIEQLETIVGVEQKRRDLVRFTSGTGQDAGKHDDIVIALCLSMESQSAHIGRSALPLNFRSCYRAASIPNFDLTTCYLFDNFYVPSGCPCCKACPGHQHVRAAYQLHIANGGDPMPLREFKRKHVLPNDWVSVVKANRWADLQGI